MYREAPRPSNQEVKIHMDMQEARVRELELEGHVTEAEDKVAVIENDLAAAQTELEQAEGALESFKGHVRIDTAEGEGRR